MTTATVFDLASLTKPVATATLVMQLAAAGKFDLDAPAKRSLRMLAGFDTCPRLAQKRPRRARKAAP